jgi:MSHA biogenesis protein MshL
MKPQSHAPLYGRLVQMPTAGSHAKGPADSPPQRNLSALPFILALAAIGLLLLLSGCASTDASKTPQRLMPEIRKELAEPSRPAPEALPPDVSRELLPPADLSLGKLAKGVSEPRFDLNVVGLPVSEVFAALARDSRYSILVDPDLKAIVTVCLKDVTLVESLQTLRELYGFEYRVEGSRIFVQKPELQTRVFQINYPVSDRAGRSDVRVISGSITGSTGSGTNNGTSGTAPTSAPNPGQGGNNTTTQESSRITTQSHNALWPEVEAGLKVLLAIDSAHPNGRQLIVSPQSGVIVVRAMPSELREVDHYLHAMQLSIEREVMLEAKIIQVTLSDSTQTGVNWAAFHPGSRVNASAGMLTPGATLGTTGTLTDSILNATAGSVFAQTQQSTSPLFGLALQTSSFATLLEFLQTQGNVQVLSSPRIAAVNNQQAVLKVGTDDFFITGITTNITGGATTGGTATNSQTITLQPFFSGVALDVTPQIDDDGNIILHVHPSVSSVTERKHVLDLGTLGTYNLPLASSTVSETDTVVRVRDGNIVAIGGLMNVNRSNTRNGLPGNSDIPVLGALLRSAQQSDSKQELVILIKPTLVRSQSQLDALREDALQRLGTMTDASKL